MVCTHTVTKENRKLRYRKVPSIARYINKKFCSINTTPIFAVRKKTGTVLKQVEFAFQQLAEVAHLVEHDLAKVGVAGSSPVFRSKL